MILTITNADFSQSNLGTNKDVGVNLDIDKNSIVDVSIIPNSVEKGQSINWTITLKEGYTFDGDVTVTMDGGSANYSVDGKNVNIVISSVTGRINITIPTKKETYTITYKYINVDGETIHEQTTEQVEYGTYKNFATSNDVIIDGYKVSSVIPIDATITENIEVTYTYIEGQALSSGIVLLKSDSKVEQDADKNITYVDNITYDTYAVSVDESSTYNLNFGDAIVLTEGSDDMQTVNGVTYGIKSYDYYNSSILSAGKAYAADNLTIGEAMPEAVTSSANCIGKLSVKSGTRVRVEGHTYLSGVLATLTDENNIVYNSSKKAGSNTTSYSQVNMYVESDGYLYLTARINDTDDFKVSIEKIAPSVNISTETANTLIVSAEKSRTIGLDDLVQSKCYTQSVGEVVSYLTTSGMNNCGSEPIPVRAGDVVSMTTTISGNTTPCAILADIDNICYKRYEYGDAKNGLTFTIEEDGILYLNGNSNNGFTATIQFNASKFKAIKQ